MTNFYRHALTALCYAFLSFALSAQIDADNSPLIDGFLTLRLMNYAFLLMTFYSVIRTYDAFRVRA